jgi:hypothetical protein
MERMKSMPYMQQRKEGAQKDAGFGGRMNSTLEKTDASYDFK